MPRVYEFLRFEAEMDGLPFPRENPRDVIGRHMKPAMARAGHRAAEAARDRVPVATGRFRDSIRSRVAPSGLRATVSEQVPYGGAVDFGARFEGAPPVPALAEWARVKLGAAGDEALGIAMAISRSKRGTRQQGVAAFPEAFDSTLGTNLADLERALGPIVEDL